MDCVSGNVSSWRALPETSTSQASSTSVALCLCSGQAPTWQIRSRARKESAAKDVACAGEQSPGAGRPPVAKKSR